MRMKYGTTHKTTKGYPRMSAGPLSKQYVHRIVAAAMIGRALKKDEQVHHRDGNRKNPWFENLFILGEYDHGWVSAKQAYFMQHLHDREEDYFKSFLDDRAKEQQKEIAAAKATGSAWEYEDGKMEGDYVRQRNAKPQSIVGEACDQRGSQEGD